MGSAIFRSSPGSSCQRCAFLPAVVATGTVYSNVGEHDMDVTGMRTNSWCNLQVA